MYYPRIEHLWIKWSLKLNVSLMRWLTVFSWVDNTMWPWCYYCYNVLPWCYLCYIVLSWCYHCCTVFPLCYHRHTVILVLSLLHRVTVGLPLLHWVPTVLPLLHWVPTVLPLLHGWRNTTMLPWCYLCCSVLRSSYTVLKFAVHCYTIVIH